MCFVFVFRGDIYITCEELQKRCNAVNGMTCPDNCDDLILCFQKKHSCLCYLRGQPRERERTQTYEHGVLKRGVADTRAWTVGQSCGRSILQYI